MNKKILASLLLSFLSAFAFAQKPYMSSGGDFIFSYANATDSAGHSLNSAVRFSGWYNADQTMNIDFGKAFGMQLGFALHNVGMITRPSDSVRIKQRTYNFGIPLGLKIGDLENRIFFTLGAEAEFMIDYKEKVFLEGKKVQKHHEFFSDNNTELFSPSVFVKFQKKNVYLQAKYYLNDFLKPQNIIVNNSLIIPSYPKTSQMFYISLGYSSKAKAKGKKISEPKKVNLTMLHKKFDGNS